MDDIVDQTESVPLSTSKDPLKSILNKDVFSQRKLLLTEKQQRLQYTKEDDLEANKENDIFPDTVQSTVPGPKGLSFILPSVTTEERGSSPCSSNVNVEVITPPSAFKEDCIAKQFNQTTSPDQYVRCFQQETVNNGHSALQSEDSSSSAATLPPVGESNEGLDHSLLQKLHLQAIELEDYRQLVKSLNRLKDTHAHESRKVLEELEHLLSTFQHKSENWKEVQTQEPPLVKQSEKVISQLIVAEVFCRAQKRMLEEENKDIKEDLVLTKSRLKTASRLNGYLQGQLQEAQRFLEKLTSESTEICEFVEIEKQILEDALKESCKELDQKKTELIVQQGLFEKEVLELKDEMEKLSYTSRQQETKAFRYYRLANRIIDHLQEACAMTEGEELGLVRLDSGVIRQVLTQWKSITLGQLTGLPSEPFSLDQKVLLLQEEVAELTDKVSMGISERNKLQQLLCSSQAEATAKMEVLKSNLERADSEIVQLDDIVDQVVEVMTKNVDTVKTSPPLMKLLQNLTGAQ